MNLTIPAEDIKILQQMRSAQLAYYAGNKRMIGRCKALERQADIILAKFPKDDGLFAEEEKE